MWKLIFAVSGGRVDFLKGLESDDEIAGCTHVLLDVPIQWVPMK